MNIEEFQQSMGNVTFYDAVVLDDDGEAYVDMDMARDIWMDYLRTIRNLKLSYWDNQWSKAMDNSDQDTMDLVPPKRQELRDMPETYDLSVAEEWQDLLTMYPDYIW